MQGERGTDTALPPGGGRREGGELCRKEVCAGRGRNADLPDPDKRGIWSGYLLSGYKGAYISRFGIRVGL